MEALGNFGTGTAAAIPTLQALLADPDRSIRDAAVKSLATLEAQSHPDAGGEPRSTETVVFQRSPRSHTSTHRVTPAISPQGTGNEYICVTRSRQS